MGVYMVLMDLTEMAADMGIRVVLIRTGEHTGRLEETLNKVAEYYEHEAETTVDRMSRIIPLLVYLMIMGLIAWKIISFYLGYYGPLFDLL